MKVIRLYPSRPPKWLRWTLIALLILILIPVLLLLALQTDPVQSFVRNKAENYLQEKLKTKVTIGGFKMSWFSSLELTKVFIADQQNKAFLYSGSLQLRYDLLAILSNKLLVRSIEWDQVLLNAYSLPDGSMNYQFIIDAFKSQDTTTVVTDSSEAMVFDIRRLSLKNLRLRYNDEGSGMYATLKLKDLSVRMDKLEPAAGIYTIRELKTDGLEGVYHQAYRKKSFVAAGTDQADPDNATALLLKAKLLEITHSYFVYDDEGSGIRTGWGLQELSLKLASFDTKKTTIQAGFVKLEEPFGFLRMTAALDSSDAVKDTSDSPNSWVVQSPEFILQAGRFRLDNMESKPSIYKNAFDPAHFFLSPLDLSIKDLQYTPKGITAALEKLQVADKSGFIVRRGQAKIVYTDSLVSLKQLVLETNNSHIADEINITGPGWSNLSGNTEKLGLNATLIDTRLVLNEALYFVPEYRNDKNFRKLWNKTVNLNGRIAGSLTDLGVQQLMFSDNVGNRINVTGRIKNPTDTKKIYAALSNLDISTGNQSIRSWIPDGSIPNNIELPASLHANGSFSGNMESINTAMQVRSSFGNASFAGRIENITDSINSRYDINLKQLDMNIGRWIKDTAIGRVVANGKVKGRGFTLSRLVADGDITVKRARYNGYDYHDIQVKGNMDRGNYDAAVSSLDSNLQAAVQLKGNFQDKYPTVAGAIKLDRVDLMAIGLSTSPLVVKGAFDVDLKNSTPRHLVGDFYASNVQMADVTDIYSLDSIRLTARADSGMQTIHFDSPFGYAYAKGDFDYTSIFAQAQAIVQHHLQPGGKDSLARKKTATQTMDLEASLSWPKNLKNLAPGLEMNQPLTINAHVNTDSTLVVANAFLQSFRYDSLRVDSTLISLLANSDSVHLDAGISALKHPSFPLNRTRLTTHGQNADLDWGLRIDDKQLQEKYRLAGAVAILPDSGYDIRMAPELLLNKLVFSTGETNLIQIRKNGLASANLQLLSGEQSLKLQTGAMADGKLPPVDLEISKFKLSTITGVLGKDSALAEALIDGKVNITNLDQDPNIAADLLVQKIVVTGNPVGDLAVKLSTPAAKQYQIDAALSGFENDVKVQGTYSDQLQFDVLLNKLNLASVEPFSMGQASRMKGFANGKLTVTGTTAKPKVLGEIGFTNGQATISMINTTLQLPSDKLVFDEQGIQFNKFTLKDSLGGTTNIDGRINSTDYSNFAFDLKVNMDNFNVLGPKANSDQLYYGPAFIDSKINITGDLNLPVIDMEVKLRDKSNLTVTIPEEEPGIEERDGVILLVNRANTPDSSLLQGDTVSLVNDKIKGMDFSAAIEVTKTSTINIIVDPVNGDYLEAKGNATLNLTIDPSSKMTLTGRYEIEEGKYELSLNQLIKRSFSIQKGSSITWDGDVMEAELDIAAKNEVRAPAIDLISDQLTSSNVDRRQYNQRIPVEVFLIIKDKLLKPAISFRLDMPEKDQSVFNGIVYARIKQINQIESQLNKQVMGLLVLQSFISEDPFSTFDDRAGGSMAGAARESVSKVLSQQLNNLAANLIKGVDLNFDLQSEEDYSTGSKSERTTLNVGASKTLFNERLTVAVGSNIGIAGNTPGNASALIGDVTVDYAVSRDGRYKLRAYQRNQTDAILQGQIIETGLTFMLVMDYDHFREIFRKSKEEKELIKKEKESKKKK